MFDLYYEFGLKTKKPEELQAEYLQLLDSRLKEVGLEMPRQVEPDYDMRMGYEADESSPLIAART
ncbi:MAG: hypothetical protein MZU95_14025 [Desulfomicrobium escambiense]|nr:hypothetical protein [Desulfomicrobium escambiense]